MANAPTPELLVSRWRKNVYREVLLEGDRIIKRYRIPAQVKRYTRPWECEHPALERLAAQQGFPKSYGYETVITDENTEITHTRDYVPGTPIETYGVQEAKDMGRLLARIHAALVVTDDAQKNNFIRDKSGEMQFIDFGKARLFSLRTPVFYLHVGHDLYDAMRMSFSGDRPLGKQLIDTYRCTALLPPMTFGLVRIGIVSAAVSRWLKRTLRIRDIRRGLRKIVSRSTPGKPTHRQGS